MAKLAASKLGSNYVGTEHLLIAIIEDGESFAVRFLQMLGVDPQSVANTLSSALSDGIPSIKLPQRVPEGRKRRKGRRQCT